MPPPHDRSSRRRPRAAPCHRPRTPSARCRSVPHCRGRRRCEAIHRPPVEAAEPHLSRIRLTPQRRKRLLGRECDAGGVERRRALQPVARADLGKVQYIITMPETNQIRKMTESATPSHRWTKISSRRVMALRRTRIAPPRRGRWRAASQGAAPGARPAPCPRRRPRSGPRPSARGRAPARPA